MSLEVEFITLGDAASRINVPAATLRNWTDQLEEYGAHYTMRNNRNERIYYQEDIDIFSYLNAMKKEFGRRTTTKDLAQMLIAKGEAGEFRLRPVEDAPMPTDSPSNKVNELINHEDIQKILNSGRARQVVEAMFLKVSEENSVELLEKIDRKLQEQSQVILAEIREKDKREEERLARMEELAKKLETAEQKSKELPEPEPEKPKSFWDKILGK